MLHRRLPALPLRHYRRRAFSPAPPLPIRLYLTRFGMGSTLVPSVSPGTSPSASFAAAAPSSLSVPCLLSLACGSHLPVAAAEREPELGCAVLGCVLAHSWAVFPSLALGPRRPKMAVGQLTPVGWSSSSRMNCFSFILYYLKFEMV